MQLLSQVKGVIGAAKAQVEAEILQFSDFCVSKAVNEIVEISGESIPASEELKSEMVGIFTEFKKSPVGIALHVKSTLELFKPALPRSLAEVKSIKQKSASLLVEEAKKRVSELS